MGRREGETSKSAGVKIRILGSAFEDLAEGERFYEEQAEGVGEHFLNCLFSDIDSLKQLAGIHPKFFGFHRLLSKRFPWAVYYRVDLQVVIVFRVLDCRQDPSRTRSALRRD